MAFVSSAWLIKSPFSSNQCARGRATRREVTIAVNRRTVSMSGPVEEKGGGMRLIRAADEETISKLGCRSWGTWGCEPSTFPWTYADDEVCLVLEGDFTVTSDNGGDAMDVQAGDVAYFPKGMSCTWEVRKAVNKHFVFGMKL